MDNWKLYILMRGDISPEQQAVQAGHVVAMFCQKYPHIAWRNGKLIYLQLRDHKSIWLWQNILSKLNQTENMFEVWQDPDYYGNEDVGMFVYGPEAEYLLRDLPLMRFK